MSLDHPPESGAVVGHQQVGELVHDDVLKAAAVARGEVMPYERITELPDSVKDNLPKHTQEIYKEAYNSAWDQYDEPSEREGDASREETSHKVAWSAVKQSYEKNDDGRWVKKD